MSLQRHTVSQLYTHYPLGYTCNLVIYHPPSRQPLALAITLPLKP